MSGLIHPTTVILNRAIQQFTQSTNTWAKIMRRAMDRKTEAQHIHRLVMWRERKDGLRERGEWWLSELEKLEFDRIARVQQEAIETIQATVGVAESGDICARLIEMMTERYPDLVQWTTADPIREREGGDGDQDGLAT